MTQLVRFCFADQSNHVIRKIDSEGNVSTFAGTGSSGSSDGNGTNASFNNPYGIAFDSADNFYVVDSSNRKIRKIDPDGNVTTFAGSGTKAKLMAKERLHHLMPYKYSHR